MPVYQSLLRRLLSSELQEFPICMPPSSLGQSLAHQRNLELPLGVIPQGSKTFVGALAPPPHQITPRLSAPPESAGWLPHGLCPGLSIQSRGGDDSGSSSERELNDVCPQDMSHNALMRVVYRDLVPMTRLFSTWLPISEGNWRVSLILFKGGTSPWTYTLPMRTSRRWKGAPP